MLVKIPRDLQGASLLKAHTWVKGHVVRTNPGGSMDYKLFDASGNQMTLSDVTRNPNQNVTIEVDMIEGVRTNRTSFAPLPEMEFKYPELPRLGNDLTEILPDEIDPVLATRIIAEQGLNRGLHTLNRLLHDKAATSVASPTTAALIQISDAVRKNPRTPFTKRSPQFYGAEKALETWVQDELGAEIKAEGTTASVLAGKAKIAARYGLNKQDIQKFAKDVLSDYMFGAAANRGLLRALIRNVPELRADRETIQKIVYMFPMNAQAYYEGRQRVFVANPAFIYPIFAETLMDKRFAKKIVNFAKGYPNNMGRKGKIPASLLKYTTEKISTSMGQWEGFRAFVIGHLTGIRRGNDLDTLYRDKGYWNTILDHYNQDMHKLVMNSKFRPLFFFPDLGGFYPSPPPKWPQPLVYSIMDTFLENLPYLMNTDSPVAEMVMSPMGIDKNYLKIDPDKTYKLKLPTSKKAAVAAVAAKAKKTKGQQWKEKKVSGQDLIYALGTEDIFGYLHDQGKFQSTHKNINKVWKEAEAEKDGIATSRTKDLIKAYQSRVFGREVIVKALHKSLGIDPNYEKPLHTIQYDSSGPKSLLEMAYEVADTAMGKYDYKVNGDDFTFIMAMLTVSFHTLNDLTEDSFFEVTSRGIPKVIERIIGGDQTEQLARLKERMESAQIDPHLRVRYEQSIWTQTLQVKIVKYNEELDNIEYQLAGVEGWFASPETAQMVINMIKECEEFMEGIETLGWPIGVRATAVEIIMTLKERASDMLERMV